MLLNDFEDVFLAAIKKLVTFYSLYHQCWQLLLSNARLIEIVVKIKESFQITPSKILIITANYYF
jgi:hypothetical protein